MTTDVHATDWRGTPLAVGDLVCFPYAWGGQPLAMCEGEVIELHTELDTMVCKVDLHYDNGSYNRRNSWAWVNLERVTRVEPRLLVEPRAHD